MAYARHLRLVASNRKDDPRGRVAELRAEQLEIENARARSELVPKAEVLAADEAIWTALRDSALALPDAVADQLCDIADAQGPAGVAEFLRSRIEAFLIDAADAEFEPAKGNGHA